MLKSFHTGILPEAGCDEAGRGCLAGPVFAAAVVLPRSYKHPMLNDSKQLSALKREKLKTEIYRDALAWSVAQVSAEEVDRINILNASILAMHRALDGLKVRPGLILVDGNRFKKYRDVPHHCIIRGDGEYLAIAAASILAKTARDEFMQNLHHDFPQFGWFENKGYPTRSHKDAINKYGISPWHRKSFRLSEQLILKFME